MFSFDDENVIVEHVKIDRIWFPSDLKRFLFITKANLDRQRRCVYAFEE